MQDAPWGPGMQDAPWHRTSTLLGGACVIPGWIQTGCFAVVIAGEARAEAAGPYEHSTGRGGVSKHSVWKDTIRESGQN